MQNTSSSNGQVAPVWCQALAPFMAQTVRAHWPARWPSTTRSGKKRPQAGRCSKSGLATTARSRVRWCMQGTLRSATPRRRLLRLAASFLRAPTILHCCPGGGHDLGHVSESTNFFTHFSAWCWKSSYDFGAFGL